MSQRVGIVGMGLMGQAFIRNMRETGFEVQGFDVDAARMDDLRAKGGHPVETPAAAASGVRFVVTSLPDSAVVREAVFGAGGIAEGAQEGLYHLDTTTARPEDSIRLSEDLAERGVRFLDAAVSGTSAMAVEKDLVVVAGGAAEDFDACRAVLAGFSRAAYYMGPVGSGARTKLVVNLILAGNRLALAEGLLLGTKAGLEMDTLLEVLQDGACYSKTMIDKGPKMVRADYAKQGQVKTSLKDSRLMTEQGRRHGSPMLLTNLWSQVAQMAYERGYGEEDTVAFYEVLREMAGLPSRIETRR